MLEFVEINTGPNPNASVIWLHGLGADGHDFADIVSQLKLPSQLQVRFLFPHAPVRAVTLNGGMHMRAWFDIYGLTAAGPIDSAGVRASQLQIEELLDREIKRGIKSERIILAGFSQGGVMSVHCGLRYAHKLAGILVLSGFFIEPENIESEASINNRATPVLFMHGDDDHIVAMQMGKLGFTQLKQLGYRTQWKSYHMQHNVCPEEVNDISNWMQDVLST